MEIRKIRFTRHTNETGSLAFLESVRDIPFSIKRVYYIFDVAKGAHRGFHGHKKLQQVLICIRGSCKVLLDDGVEKAVVELNDPTEGLYGGNAVWREMFEFSSGAVLLVLASEYFDESDYIRDYKEFLSYVREGGK